MGLARLHAERLANQQAAAGYPKGDLIAKNGQEPYPKDYAYLVKAGKRRVYTDEANQRWVKVFGTWWKFPEQIEL